MYTREDVLGMVAGRELDGLVMTTIFEARRGYYGDEEVWYHRDENGEPDYEWPFYNSPSTDLVAAFEVADKMHKNGHGLSLEYFPEDLEWYADFDELKLDSGCLANSAPLAICRAALLSLLKED